MDKFVTVTGAEALYRSSRDQLALVEEQLTDQLELKADGARVSDDGKYLYLTSGGSDITGPLGPFSGGGGGGGGGSINNAKLELKNLNPDGWLATTIAEGAECVITVTWSSIEDGFSTGTGTMEIKANGAVKKTVDVSQGVITEDITSYLVKGKNNIRLSVTDVYGNSRTLSFNITVVALSLESSFDGSVPYTGEISYSYIVSGLGDKVIYFYIDGELIGSEPVANTGRQYTYILPAQTHGSHSLEVYFISEIDELSISSPHLYYDLVCYEPGNTTPVISVPLASNSTDQYTNVTFTYSVHTPNVHSSPIQIYINGVIQVDLEVDETPQHFSYRFDNYGTQEIKFVSGTCTKIIEFIVKKNESVHIQAETSNLSLYLTSTGRSNQENPPEHKYVWEYEGITASLTAFDWVSNGWVKDKDNYPVLRLSGASSVVIPYKVFAPPTDSQKHIKKTGKTIEIEFSTSAVSNYDFPIITCFDENVNRGLKITAQEALLKTNKTQISTQYKENEHIRIAFVINKTDDHSLLYCYTNGVISGIIQYADDDLFDADAPIVIGSYDSELGTSAATVDIYNIRVYDNNLTHYQITNNWIADMQDSAKMIEQFNRNNVFDDNNVITIDNLPIDVPYFVFMGKTLPTSKDSILLDGYFVNRLHPERNFTFTKAEVGCQGTSSMAYPIKNFKLKFKKAETWLDNQGKTIKKYAINDEALPTNKFVFKADYASSEGANNVELVRFYNDLCKEVYLTPPQRDPENPTKVGDARIRQGIDGFPMVVFQNRGDEGIRFIGKYNFNNDKGTPEVYGLDMHGETIKEIKNEAGKVIGYEKTADGEPDQSWEMKDNTAPIPNWHKVAENAGQLLISSGGFEVRYPDVWQDAWDGYATAHPNTEERPNATYEDYIAGIGTAAFTDVIDPSDFIALQAWVNSTDTTQCTGDPLPETVYYDGTPYEYDNREYRLAKFRAELGDHFDVDDSTFYYIFTEFFLMIDSRVKNSFPTKFSADEKWIWFPYDMDTAIGINNEGKLVYSYNLEDTDIEPGTVDQSIFNGKNPVFWDNFRACFFGEIKAMYKTLRAAVDPDTSKEIFSYEEIEKRFEDHQNTWPAAVFNEDAYYKYVIPFLGGNPDLGIEAYGPALTMCLGAKTEQRKWWLYNRFRFLDSKYEAGLATKLQISFRAYAVGDIYVTPYYDIYIKALFGKTLEFYQRGYKNHRTLVPVQLEKEGSEFHDTEVFINSADQIMKIEGLANAKPDTVEIMNAINLQELDLAAEANDPNYNLKELTFGSNTLLRIVKVTNCPNLTQDIKMPNCVSLKEVYFDGTCITGITLPPDGGLLEVLSLPNTIKGLKILGQKELRVLNIEGLLTGTQLTSVRLEQVSDYTWERAMTILRHMAPVTGTLKNNVRLIGFNYNFANVQDFEDFITLLDSLAGLDSNDNSMVVAQIAGTANVTGTIPYEEVIDIQRPASGAEDPGRYPNLRILCKVLKTVKFYNYDGTQLLDTQTSDTVTDVPGSVTYQGAALPVHADTATVHYTWDGWSLEPNGELVFTQLTELTDIIDKSYNLYAHFHETPIYTVKFWNYDGTEILDTQYTRPDIGSFVDYRAATPFVPTGEAFLGWGSQIYAGVTLSDETEHTVENITESLDFYAQMDWGIIENSITVSGNYQIRYFQGETFNPAGLIVKVRKHVPGGPEGGIEAQTFDYTYDQSPFTLASTAVDITVNEQNVKPIAVAIAQSIEVTKDPDLYFQYTGQPLDLTGMEITIHYSDDSIEPDSDVRHIGYYLPELGPGEDQVLTEDGYNDIVVYYYRGMPVLSTIYTILALTHIYENLEDNSWATISAAVQANRVPNSWAIGNEKGLHFGGSFIDDTGTLTSNAWLEGDYTFRILAFDHNLEKETPKDPVTNEPLYQHSVTFGLAKIKKFAGYTKVYDNIEYVGAGVAPQIREEDREAADPDNYYPAWSKSWHWGNKHTEVCDNFYKYMIPEELRKVIKPVIKSQSDHNWTEPPAPNSDTSYHNLYILQTQENYVYIPSYYEITGSDQETETGAGGGTLVAGAVEAGSNQQFEYYRTLAIEPHSRIRYFIDGNQDESQKGAIRYFTRSWNSFKSEVYPSVTQFRYHYAGISATGQPTTIRSINSDGMVLCFTL